MDFSFINDKRWFQETPETQQRMLDNAFQRDVASDKRFSNETPEVQETMRKNYMQQAESIAYYSPANPTNIEANRNQSIVDSQSFLPIAGDKFKNSFKSLGTAISIADDMMAGEFDDNTAKKLANDIARQRSAGIPKKQKELMAELNVAAKEFDTAKTTWSKTKAFLGGIGDIVTNPVGSVYTGLDSISSLGTSLAGGKLGAKTGAGVALLAGQVGPQVGAPEELATVPIASSIGGTLGVFLSSLPASAQAKFQEDVLSELESKKLVPNEKNIQKLLQDKNFTETAIDRAQKYAANIGAGEAFTSLVLGGLQKPFLAPTTLSSNLAKKAGLFSLETISEGGVEALAQTAIGDDVNMEEVFAEMAGGFGMAPVSTAIDKSIFAGETVGKIGRDQFKKAITPKSEEHKQATKLKKYDRSFEATQDKDLPADTNISEFTNPEHKNYNPIKAINILANSKDIDSVDKAKDIANDYDENIVQKHYDELDALALKEKEGTLTSEDVKRFKQLQKADKDIAIVQNKLTKAIQSLEKQSIEKIQQETDITPIDPKTSTDEDIKDNIIKSFGSHGGKNTANNDDLIKASKRTDLSKDIKSMMQSVINMNISSQNLNDFKIGPGKTMAQVSTDVHKGSGNFKGIDHYLSQASQHIQSGNIAGAKKAVTGLTSFANKHNNKAQILSEIYQDVIGAKKAKPATVSEFKEMQKKNPNLRIEAYSGNMVKMIQLEAETLNNAVKVANSLVNVPLQKEDTKTKSAVTIEPKKQETVPSKEKSKKPLEAKPEPIRKAIKNRIKAAKETGNVEILNKALDSKNINETERKVLTDVKNELTKKEKVDGEKKQKVQSKDETKKEEKIATKPILAIPEKHNDILRKLELRFKIVDNIPTTKNKPVIMRNTGKEILYNPDLLDDKFKEKAWTKPALQHDNSKATKLPNDAFKTPEELLEFMVMHENMHNHIKRKSDESIGEYEDRINQAAFNKLNISKEIDIVTLEDNIIPEQDVISENTTDKLKASEINFGSIEVLVRDLNGNQTSQPFDKVLKIINKEIELYKKMRNCLKQ